ncbi:MAG: hypothetical protein WBA54_12390 [Acidaminobacteraceae bacterium]
MSKFLAPIHFWLFDKINLHEAMEMDFRSKLINDTNESLISTIKNEFGAVIGTTALEEIIDQGNIHGWLQAQITNAEKRQAFLITNLIATDKESTLKAANETYFEFGKSAGEKALAEKSVSNTQDIYNQLNNHLLEGMPCDRVNSVSEVSDTHISWITSRCLHKDYWDQVGGDIHVYYELKSSFINGFLSGLNTKFTYSFEDATDPSALFVHKIV